MRKVFKFLFCILIGLVLGLSVLNYKSNEEIKKLDKIVDQQEVKIEEQEGRIVQLEQIETKNKATIGQYENELKTCQENLAKKN